MPGEPPRGSHRVAGFYEGAQRSGSIVSATSGADRRVEELNMGDEISAQGVGTPLDGVTRGRRLPTSASIVRGSLLTGVALLVVGAVLLIVAGLTPASSVTLLVGAVLAIGGGLGWLYAWPMPSTADEIAAREAALNSTAMSQDSW